MGAVPTGTVTFLFTDIVGSSALWDADGEQMARALAQHDFILEQTADEHNGYVFKRVGDGFCIAFESAEDALRAAVAGQKALAEESWVVAGRINVRMGLHTGTAELRNGDYFGPTVNRAARIQGLAYRGQILLSEATERLVADRLLLEIDLLDLGRHELAGLARPEQIFQAVSPGLMADFPPLKSRIVCPNNLPLSSTPFVGREAELVQLESLIADGRWRLITIVGPGGMGKTRLALELARRQSEPVAENGEAPALPFPDGVFFAALAGVETPAEIPPALFRALGFQPGTKDPAGRSSWQQFLDQLSGSKMLLILDNFEQLTESAAMVGELIAAAPGTTVVVTSRQRLSLRGEQLFSLAGMAYPETPADALARSQAAAQSPNALREAYSALAMFLQSCERVNPSLAWTDQHMAEAIRICQLLGGLPLAIELAAGWVEMLSLAEIAAEIQGDLDFLQTDVKDIEERHRSVRTVFEGTWSGLGPEDRALFASLCVFRGGFSRAAAQEVAGASLLQLARLVKLSLLQYDAEQERYEIHRLLRQYGEGKLSRQPDVAAEARDRHSAYFAQQMARWYPAFESARQLEVMAGFDQELANVQSAWKWSVERADLVNIDLALKALGSYCEWRFLPDVLQDACSAAAAMLGQQNTPEAKRILAHVLAWQGLFLPHQDDLRLVEESRALLTEASAAGQDVRAEKAFTLTRLGMLLARAEREAALASLQDAQRLNEELGDRHQTTHTLWALTYHALMWGDYGAVARYVNQLLEVQQQLGDRRGMAQSHNTLGVTATYLGDFEQAEHHLEQCMVLSKQVHDKNELGIALNHMGFLLLNAGRYGESRAAYRQDLSLMTELNFFFAEPVAMIAYSLTQEGRYEEALERIERTSGRSGLQTNDRGNLDWSRGIALLGLGRRQEALVCLQRSARVFEKLGQLTVYSGVTSFLLMSQAGQGEVGPTIRLANQAGSILAHMMALPAVALYFLDQGDTMRAVELYAAAAEQPFVANSKWYANLVSKPIDAAASMLPAAAVAAAKARGRQRKLEAIFAELAAEFDIQESAAP